LEKNATGPNLFDEMRAVRDTDLDKRLRDIMMIDSIIMKGKERERESREQSAESVCVLCSFSFFRHSEIVWVARGSQYPTVRKVCSCVYECGGGGRRKSNLHNL
jgi:hypothetical protein